MKTILKSIAAVCVGLALVACNKMSPEEMAKAAERVVVKCNPEVLVSVNGNIDAELTVTFPEEYFNPKGNMVVTPVLVYEGGEVAGEQWTYQGEKVQDNNTVVTTEAGCVANHKVSFKFVEGMEKAHLELRAVASKGKQSAEMPVRKVADGVNITGDLLCKVPVCTYKADGYQAVIKTSEVAQILYSINTANYNSRQLSNADAKAFQKNVQDLKANERYTSTGMEIVSYASPDGGQELNAKLSDKRSTAAEKAWKTLGKKLELGDASFSSVGQDWEGFQAAVAASDIQDKDLIIRVLSMYRDPEVREKEIKNISEVYNELKTKVLPELRRSRFVANFDFRNYNDEELQVLAQQGLDDLDEPSLLHLAAISNDAAQKEMYYNKAVEKFSSESAAFNLVVMNIKNGNVEAAKSYLAKLGNVANPDVQNLDGAVAFLSGNCEAADKAFKESNTVEARANIGLEYMLKGDYKTAVSYLPNGINKAICYLMLDNASAASDAVTGDCAVADYVRAICAARQGNKADTEKYLETATTKCDKLKARAEKDIEFRKFAE